MYVNDVLVRVESGQPFAKVGVEYWLATSVWNALLNTHPDHDIIAIFDAMIKQRLEEYP